VREKGDRSSFTSGSGRFSRGRPFLDTAAVVANLDLVVRADTAAVHLAVALGMPV
jgi:ADP-heptose:LPS heptosyltransferase